MHEAKLCLHFAQHTHNADTTQPQLQRNVLNTTQSHATQLIATQSKPKGPNAQHSTSHTTSSNTQHITTHTTQQCKTSHHTTHTDPHTHTDALPQSDGHSDALPALPAVFAILTFLKLFARVIMYAACISLSYSVQETKDNGGVPCRLSLHTSDTAPVLLFPEAVWWKGCTWRITN